MSVETDKARSTTYYGDKTFGDLTIKDLTSAVTCGSYSESTSSPSTYVESARGGTSYSKPKEIDSGSYPSLIPPV